MTPQSLPEDLYGAQRRRLRYAGTETPHGGNGHALRSPAIASCPARGGEGLERDDFVPVATRGFGDPENSYAFSMCWLDDALYVGTGRDIFALIAASPPKHPAGLTPWPVPRPADIFQLDLRAQIWRYRPAADRWKQIYVSPIMRGRGGQPTPRDLGYRNMTAVRAPGDSEACLYVATASSSSRGRGAHVLRYSPGHGVEPVTEPGLGDSNVTTFRALTAVENRLYCAPAGSGRAWNAADRPRVYTAADLASSRWRTVSPPHLGDDTNDAIYCMTAFNGHLYAGTLNPKSGYQIWKTRVTGDKAHRWIKVVDRGAARGNLNEAAVSMCVFDNALYVGSGISNGGYNRTHQIGPAAGEVIRVHPDDSWEICVGEGRQTPFGYRRSLSGMGPGFDNPFAGYIWSMAAHDGWLYVGTFDSGIFALWADPQRQPVEQRYKARFMGVDDFVRQRAGFDLWRTNDGQRWEPVTRNGFDNPYNYGVRTMASTPYGLFVGTANPFGPSVAARFADGWRYVDNPRGGAEVWLGLSDPGRFGRRNDPARPAAQPAIALDPDRPPEMPPVPPAGREDLAALLPHGPWTPRLKRLDDQWRAAAREAADASFDYHLFRLTSAIARRRLADDAGPASVPEWALEVHDWEHGNRGKAFREAVFRCFRASAAYHQAGARRETVRLMLTRGVVARAGVLKQLREHLQGVRRANRRLARAMARSRRQLAQPDFSHDRDDNGSPRRHE
jgi:hypothetical protein